MESESSLLRQQAPSAGYSLLPPSCHPSWVVPPLTHTLQAQTLQNPPLPYTPPFFSPFSAPFAANLLLKATSLCPQVPAGHSLPDPQTHTSLGPSSVIIGLWFSCPSSPMIPPDFPFWLTHLSSCRKRGLPGDHDICRLGPPLLPTQLLLVPHPESRAPGVVPVPPSSLCAP